MSGRLPLFTEAFLHARWDEEFARFRGSAEEAALLERLRHWAGRPVHRETQASAAFIDVFFKDTWGYVGSGQTAPGQGYTFHPEFPVAGAGQTGGTGAADLALGWFGRGDVPGTPQALCEFKDIASGLDAPQRRKGNDRSPVEQCADYLREASRGMFGSEPIRPTWAIVTDMNEFRLYWRDRVLTHYQRFVVARSGGVAEPVVLTDDHDEASFQRFVFSRLFHRDLLLTTAGRPSLEKLIREQGVHEREIENDFYREYQAYREEVFNSLVDANPGFAGTRGKLVRLAQRFLDRCIFVLFCEDMGAALKFPQNLLRDLLIARSVERHYDPEDTSTWHDVKRLFRAMRDGTPFGSDRINRFNGGLFDEEPELDALNLPNRIFCTRNQGTDPERWTSSPKTLLYFSARYNFGIRPAGGRTAKSIGLYTLGRIFEQSITELEFMEAKADDRPSLTELSKRKRDGVYYTPEWVTYFIVRHTVGAKIDELRERCGLGRDRGFSGAEVEQYQRAIAPKKGAARTLPATVGSVRAYLAKLDAFERELADLKVVDPACGSGAFLIQAMDELVAARRWISEERALISGAQTNILDLDALVKDVLSKNIYGVDINPESVEITRLALWLHTALPDRPLSSLDHTIRCGNSLVGPDFYRGQQQAMFTEDEKERINVFDWEAAFAEVFRRAGGKRGFDCVIGNPPYVKLQNFRQVQAPVATYLLEARDRGGGPVYRSTQTGNFDLYLPFIEKGINLLNEEGNMGYIAPSVWLVNEYGAGLRSMIRECRALDRWVDFGDYQVFEEAINYTALQFFRRSGAAGIACVFSPTGPVGEVDWSQPDAAVGYDELQRDRTWILAAETERRLLSKLRQRCTTLEQASTGIIVGIQTSADSIYHMRRIAPGRYLSFAAGREGEEVEIEDGIMRCLVSGEHVKRYRAPTSSTYLLFPYDDTQTPPPLLTTALIAREFPKAWRYLRKHESALRARERDAFDDDQWYRFGRNQNIDKQKLPKLLVPRMTTDLATACDPEGAVAIDNVDVNGILADGPWTLWFLTGVLNGLVANFAWKRGSKPFQNGFRGANKQFIAPLPIPPATPGERAEVAKRARALQQLHSARRDDTEKLARRLDDCLQAAREPTWIWEDIGTIDGWKGKNPNGLSGRALTAWAKKEVDRRVAPHAEALQVRLRPGVRLEAKYDDGALILSIDGTEALRAYVDRDEAPLLLAQWDRVTRTTTVTATFNARRLVDALLDLRVTSSAPLRRQIGELHDAIARRTSEIAMTESEMNDLLYRLYEVNAEERMLIERDRL